MSRASQNDSASLEDLLVIGPFHEALRIAIKRSGLTLERIRSRIGQRGVPLALSTLSDWQQGHRRPGTERSLVVVGILEEILGLPRRSLRGLLEYTSAGIDEDEGPIGELLELFPHSRERDLTVITEQQKVFVDQAGITSRIWTRALLRARRQGVDRYLTRYFGDPGCLIDQVRLTALENCRLGRVERHRTQSVLVGELLLGTKLGAGDTWVIEYEVRDPSGEAGIEYGHAFPRPVAQYLLEVRFDPRRLPAACHSYARPALTDALHITGKLVLNRYHAVHLTASGVRAGVVGIIWEWPDHHVSGAEGTSAS